MYNEREGKEKEGRGRKGNGTEWNGRKETGREGKGRDGLFITKAVEQKTLTVYLITAIRCLINYIRAITSCKYLARTT